MKDDLFQECADQSALAIQHAIRAKSLLEHVLAQVTTRERHITRELLQHRIDAIGLDDIEPTTNTTPGSVHTDLPSRIAAEHAAVDEWRMVVMEPPGENWERIDTYIRGDLGLGWPSADANNLGADTPYTKNRQFAWCGAFCAFCWGNAGLKSSIRHKHLASLYRLYRFAHGTTRYIDPKHIVLGDIVAMGEVDGPKYGQHMALAVQNFRAGAVMCIEGNAHGEGPYGNRYEGVVQNKRAVMGFGAKDAYQVRYGVRFLKEDLEHE